jgi:hypothetical protein
MHHNIKFVWHLYHWSCGALVRGGFNSPQDLLVVGPSNLRVQVTYLLVESDILKWIETMQKVFTAHSASLLEGRHREDLSGIVLLAKKSFFLDVLPTSLVPDAHVLNSASFSKFPISDPRSEIAFGDKFRKAGFDRSCAVSDHFKDEKSFEFLSRNLAD